MHERWDSRAARMVDHVAISHRRYRRGRVALRLLVCAALVIPALHLALSGAGADPGDADADADGIPDVSDVCPNTIPQIPVDLDGCPPSIPGDFDRDGDVDRLDLGAMQTCRSGPSVPRTDPDCNPHDLDHDGDVDQDDFGAIQLCYKGENNLGDSGCLMP